uniref:Viral Atype inclusion protein putative n=1 Tax=Albugo laibachii Nc14 TaxID=890382 RepID=F0WRJ0_9STRA|nr:viral Atype inclusion protein putative [Albugo laibachii Nc14]|eukprot:CCA23953.1 viral Atype inclusion protein putative [Albugo laibachii Nc14]
MFAFHKIYRDCTALGSDSMANTSPRSPSCVPISTPNDKQNVLHTLSNDLYSVQRQLHAMEYTEPLHIDSVPLVHHLLTDIIHTTERNASILTEKNAIHRERLKIDQMLAFFQQENLHLIQENNSLHLELIQQEESLSEREASCHLQAQKARDEANDLRFTNCHLMEQLRDKDQMVEKLRSKMESMLQMEASPSNLIVSSLPRMYASNDTFLPETKAPPMEWRDKERQLITQLETNLKELTEDHTALQTQLEQLQKRLCSRDLEIDRLASQMLTKHHEVTPEALLPSTTSPSASASQTDVQVEQLNSHVDFLTVQAVKYEAKVAQLSGQLRSQDELSAELRRYQQLCQELERELEATKSKLVSVQHNCERLEMALKQKTTSEPEISPTEELLQQKTRLEDALRACHYDKISYTNALNNATAHNRVLMSDFSQVKAQLHASQSQQTRSQEEFTQLQASFLAQTREFELIRSSLNAVEEQLRLESDKNVSLHRELRSMDTVLTTREEEAQRLNRMLTARDGQIERLTRELDHLQSKMAETPSPNHCNLAIEEQKWLQQEREQSRQQRQKLMEEIVDAEKRVQESKSDKLATEFELQKLEGMNRTLQLQLEQLQHAMEDKVSQLGLQSTELQTLHNANALLRASEPDPRRTKALETACIKLESEVASLRTESQGLVDEKAQLCVRLDALRQMDRRLQEELLNYQKSNESLEEEKSQLQRVRDEWRTKYEETSLELRAALQRAQYMESQLEQFTSDVECKQLSWTRHQASMDRCKALEMTQLLEDNQNRLKFLSSQFHEVETQLDREKRENQSVQKRVILLEEELSQARQAHEEMENRLLEMHGRISEKNELLMEKNATLEQSKVLLDRIQTSRDEATANLSQSQRELERLRLQLEEVRGQGRTHEEKACALLSELNAARRSMEAVERENDSLHDQMDALMEKIASLEAEEKSLREKHFLELEELHQNQNQKLLLEDRLEEAENRVLEMEAVVCKAKSEMDRLEQARLLEIYEKKALLSDLENMTSENQNVSEECSMMRVQLGQMEERVTQLKQRIQVVERERDSLEVERDDLESTFRSVAKQMEGVQSGRDQMSRLNEELTSVNEALRRRMEEMERGKEAEGVKIASYQLEISTYRDQISVLTDQIREKEEALAGAQAREMALEGAVTTQRSISTEISAQRYGAEAQRAASAQKMVQMEAKIGSYQLESKRIRDQIQMEQVRNAKLEGVATLLRQKMAEKEAELVAMKEQRDVLARELEKVYGSAKGRRYSPDMQVADLYMTPESAESAELEKSGTRSEGTDRMEKSPMLLPIRELVKAQEKCKELEEQLHRQDSTIQQLERSRSKFKRFAAKYEQEIEQRDRLIEELQSSAGSSGRVSRQPEEEKEHWPMGSGNTASPQTLRFPSSAEAVSPMGRQRPKRRQRNP